MAVLGREEGTIGKDEQEMIHSVVESGALSAGQFMVSRIDIMSLDLDLPREEAINLVIESGHSPIPVYRGSKDHIDGVLQARDYLVAWRRGKAGIVTIEDMLGEVLAARRDGSITVSGQIVLDDLKAKAGLALPDEEFQTLSGLLVNQLGRVPYPGEVIALPGVVFQVLDADHRRIYRLAMKKIPPQSG